MKSYQVGVFPVTEDGKVVIIQNKERSAWLFPKGQREKGIKDEKVAEEEAFEEAGLIGKVSSDYYEFKVDSTKADYLHLYPMRVKSIKDKWPEDDERKRKVICMKEAEKYLACDLRKVLCKMKKCK